jgi:hypothetical protein
MTTELIAAVAGITISLLFSYAPGVKDWYDKQPPTHKRLWMLLALLLATAGVLAYRCRGDAGCYGANAEQAVAAFVAAAIANQATYSLSPKSKA